MKKFNKYRKCPALPTGDNMTTKTCFSVGQVQPDRLSTLERYEKSASQNQSFPLSLSLAPIFTSPPGRCLSRYAELIAYTGVRTHTHTHTHTHIHTHTHTNVTWAHNSAAQATMGVDGIGWSGRYWLNVRGPPWSPDARLELFLWEGGVSLCNGPLIMAPGRAVLLSTIGAASARAHNTRTRASIVGAFKRRGQTQHTAPDFAEFFAGQKYWALNARKTAVLEISWAVPTDHKSWFMDWEATTKRLFKHATFESGFIGKLSLDFFATGASCAQKNVCPQGPQ